MESGLKQRLVGAAVLVALAVIFLPMLVQGPAPDSGVSNVPLTMPPAPRGDMETRDLPLVTPGDAPSGGAVGLAPAIPADTAAATSTTGSSAAPTTVPESTAAAITTPAPAETAPAPQPAATAAGDYAVTFGAYATPAAADTVIASLRNAPLPAYREPTTSGGKPAWRVRIGPFATRAEAESARLRAAHVRDDVSAQVVELDAAPATSPSAAAAQKAPANVATTKPAVTTPAPTQASQSTTATTAKPATSLVASAPVAAKPATTAANTTPKPPAASGTGFAVQLAAYGKASDATALRDRLRAAGFSAFTEAVTTDKGTLTRVRVGPVATRADAQQLQAQVKAKVGLDGIVRPHP
jgi:cell division septation protein DedD